MTFRVEQCTLASVALWEREPTGERTSTSMRRTTARVEFTSGRVRFGCQLVGDRVAPVASAEEQRASAIAQRLRPNGLSLRTMALHLSKRGCRSRSRSRKAFAPTQIARMLWRAV